jgi:hypothetical protein
MNQARSRTWMSIDEIDWAEPFASTNMPLEQAG